jgi:hypothetical protein
MSLAVWNLVRGIAAVASALWLALIAFVVISNIREWGSRAFLLSIPRAFSLHEVLIADADGLKVGFRIFGRNVIERRIPAQDIVSVRCSEGQARDWLVILRYQHGDGQVPIVVGPSRTKPAAEALAQQVIEFLQGCDMDRFLKREQA